MLPDHELNRRLPRQHWEWLQAEAAAWQRDGLVSAEQAGAIMRRYAPVLGSGRGRTTSVFSVLGALLVGLGAILFIAHNWWQIPNAVKLGAMLALILTAHGVGYWLWQVRGDYPRVGHALVLLGCLFFGGGIWLVAQIFHLRANWANGLLFWGLGSLPVAWALASRPALALSSVLLFLWSLFELGNTGQTSWYYPLLLAALVLPAAYRWRAPESIWLSLAGLGAWIIGQGIPWVERSRDLGPVLIFLTLGLYGTALAAVGLWHRVQPARRDLAAPYLLGGTLLALAGSYAQTFHVDFARVAESPSWEIWATIGILAAFAVVIAAVTWRLPAGDWNAAPAWVLPAAIIAFAIWLFAGLLPGDGWRAISTNLLLFLAAVGLVAWGFRQQVAAAVNLGLLAFVVQVITRYFDWFYSLLDRSIFFMIGGVLLLIGGFLLERWRRELVRGGGVSNHA